MIVRALLAAVLAGIAAGLVAAVLHLALVSPLIVEAELYETASSDAASHDHAAGPPGDGTGRMLRTFAADIVIAAGWALIMVALFALHDRPVGWRRGLLWGLAGFVATAAIPALSLPPELPGTEAGDRGLRQLAWLAIVLAGAVGLWLLAFAERGWVKAGGGLLLAIAAFAVPVPVPVSEAPAPPDLRDAFLWRALIAALAMWLAIGALAGLAFDRATAQRTEAA
jgi:cobalt transporter subunit CbtA